MISVIVPVYNVENYLSYCIDSILSQTHKDFELLLIDDGSTDNSGKICDEYAVSDSRIRVFHKINEGVSSSRNLGLDKACGDWIIFCDADDFWTSDETLTLLYRNVLYTDADIIRGEYISVNKEGIDIKKTDFSSKCIFSNKCLKASEFIKNIVAGEFFLVLCLIRRSVIGKLRFDSKMVFLEDMKFFMQLLLQNPQCTYLPFSFYAYRKTSTTASTRVDTRKLSNSFCMSDFFWILSKNCSADMIKICSFYSVMMYYWTLQTLASMPYYKKRHDIIKDLQLNAIHKRVLTRLKKVRSVNWKYYFFILPPMRVGVRLLHLKDNLRALMS